MVIFISPAKTPSPKVISGTFLGLGLLFLYFDRPPPPPFPCPPPVTAPRAQAFTVPRPGGTLKRTPRVTSAPPGLHTWELLLLLFRSSLPSIPWPPRSPGRQDNQDTQLRLSLPIRWCLGGGSSQGGEEVEVIGRSILGTVIRDLPSFATSAR
jgi:hypothetical protein